MRTREICKLFVAVLTVMTFGGPQKAQAVFALRLTQGATVITITDGGAGDVNAAVGAITFIGSIGVFNGVNVTTGLTPPAIGQPGDVMLDLNSVNVSSSTGGTLVIELTNLFPAGSGGTLIGNVGGTTDGTTMFDVYKVASNSTLDPFDTSNPLAEVHIGPFVGNNNDFAFSGSGSDDHGLLPLYRMTQRATITHGDGSGLNTSFNFSAVNEIPEPATVLSALFGVPALGYWVRRRRVAKELAA